MDLRDSRMQGTQSFVHAGAKAPTVDGHDDIGLFFDDIVHRLTDARHDARNGRNDLRQPHHRQFGRIKQAFKPVFNHRFTADAGKTDFTARFFAQRPHQTGRQQIARRFARDQIHQQFIVRPRHGIFTPVINSPSSSAFAVTAARSTIKVFPACTAMPRNPDSYALTTV